MRLSIVRTAPDQARRRGFTYFEIMIVIMILSILVLGASLFLRGFLPAARVRDTCDRLQAQLRGARMHAISTSRAVSVVLDTTARQLTTSVDENGNGTLESNEVATLSLATASPLTLTSTSTSGSFRPSGEFSTSNGLWKVIVAHAGAVTGYVYVFAAGHVQASEVPLE